MKLVFFTALLISCFIFSPTLSAQLSSSQSETQQLVNSLRNDAGLSSETKITAYEVLLEKEKLKKSVNNAAVLILNEALVAEMTQIGSYVEIKTIFETAEFLNDLNKKNENINIYVKLLSTTVNAYLMLQEYDNAKNLIAEFETYLSSYDITDLNKGNVFLDAGQLYISTGEYKDGLNMLRLAMQTFEKSGSLSEINKRKKISFVLSYIGNTYYTLGDFKNAIKYHEKGNDKAGNLSSPANIVVYNHNIASSQLELSEWEQALNTATLASQQAQNIESAVFVAFSNEIIARAKHGLGQSAEAIETIQASIATYKQFNYKQRLIEALAYEAQFHISLGNWDAASQNTIEAHSLLENAKNQAKPTIELFKSSFLIEENNNNFDKALFYQKELIKLKEEDFEAQKTQEAQRLMLDFELDLAEEKALRLEQENKLKSIIIERNESKNQFLMSVIIGTIIVLVLLVYVSMRERSLKIKMSHLAMTDHLTGCPNRRNAMYQAKAMLSEQVNKKDSMTIAILDVDNFKAINDTYGHDVGDKALQNLSSIMIDALRETDVMGRYGGEEFIILLPNAGEKEIKMIFSRIQSALKNHICEYNGKNIVLPITVSMGAAIVTHVPEQLDDNEQKVLLNSIIKKADNKTYEAKEEGKDQLKLDRLSNNNLFF